MNTNITLLLFSLIWSSFFEPIESSSIRIESDKINTIVNHQEGCESITDPNINFLSMQDLRERHSCYVEHEPKDKNFYRHKYYNIIKGNLSTDIILKNKNLDNLEFQICTMRHTATTKTTNSYQTKNEIAYLKEANKNHVKKYSDGKTISTECLKTNDMVMIDSNPTTKKPPKTNRIFSSQNSINLYRDSILNSIGYEPSSKTPQYFYYYKSLKNINSKKEMFDIMVAMNEGIDSISSIENEVILYTHYDNMNYFYKFASDFYKYKYCTWNDIYKTLFSLSKVDRVVWFNENSISTILPSSEEWPTIHPPNKVMKKKWYLEDLNYDLILDENNKHFNSDWIIEDENYMDSIMIANVNLKFKAIQCFEPDK